jgi:hypothetical protein
MSRVRAANGGATRSSEGKDLLEIAPIRARYVWRQLPGVCAIVDAWWMSSARRFAWGPGLLDSILVGRPGLRSHRDTGSEAWLVEGFVYISVIRRAESGCCCSA